MREWSPKAPSAPQSFFPTRLQNRPAPAPNNDVVFEINISDSRPVVSFKDLNGVCASDAVASIAASVQNTGATSKTVSHSRAPSAVLAPSPFQVVSHSKYSLFADAKSS